MKPLIIKLIELDYLGDMESIIFLTGFIINGVGQMKKKKKLTIMEDIMYQ